AGYRREKPLPSPSRPSQAAQVPGRTRGKSLHRLPRGPLRWGALSARFSCPFSFSGWLSAIRDRARFRGYRVRSLLRLATNPLAKEGRAVLQSHATTGAEGEKLDRFAVCKRDRPQVEADPPA